MAASLPACGTLGSIGWPGSKAEPPKVEAQARLPAAVPAPPAPAPPSAAPPAPPADKEGVGSVEPIAPADEPVTATPPAPPGSKEGPPAPRAGAPVVPGGPPGTTPAPQQGKTQYVSLNFDNADLEIVLRSIADITGINFIIGPGVKANVTMRTTTKVPASEVFSILELVLEVNNLVAVKEGSFYKIVPIAVAQQEPLDVQVGKERGEERERYVTQIVRLDYLSADETVKILQSFLAKGAKLVVHKETNSLVIAGFSSTVRRLLETIRALDLPTKRDNIQRIFVYFVENVQASQLATILNTLYGRREAVPRPPTARPGQPPPRTQPGVQPPPPPPVPGAAPPPPTPPPGAPLPPGVEALPGEVVGEVTIVSDEATNALVIKTSPRNYEIIEATIKQLDIVPKQVLIELLLAQIRLSDTFNFSLEEVLRTGSFAVSGIFGGPAVQAVQSFLSPNTVVPPKGFTLTFVEADKFRVVLNNLAAVTKVDVLANPHLLTANNKEAKIQIGQEVPIITGDQTSLTSATAATAQGLFRTFQQKDIGIIIGIKPHVNEKRLVTLEIEAENIAVDQSNFGGTGTASFLKTTTKTSVVVQDGQSLVIGGIIRTDKSKGYTGVPFLSQIPLLGYLFRSTAEVLERNELVILITPYVVASPEEGRAITEQFKKRVESLEPVLKALPRSNGADTAK
jgi:type II secretory pathway component GspD/PulD (secretin)